MHIKDAVNELNRYRGNLGLCNSQINHAGSVSDLALDPQVNIHDAVKGSNVIKVFTLKSYGM